MEKKQIIGLVALIVIVGGAIWYLTKNGADQPRSEGTGVSTFAAFLAQGGSRACTVIVDAENAAAEGTVYTQDGRIRGEFTTTANGQPIAAYMIQDDGYMYSWTDQSSQGIRVAISQAQDSGAQGQVIDPETEVSYDCSRWIPNESMFDIPSDISFTDVSSL